MRFEDPMMTRPEAARLLGCSTSALRRWAALGRGPTFVRLGRLVRYRKSSLESFIQEHSYCGHTSEAPLTAQGFHDVETRETA